MFKSLEEEEKEEKEFKADRIIVVHRKIKKKKSIHFIILTMKLVNG